MGAINVDDIIGKQFGRLTVLEYDHREWNSVDNLWDYYYLCECSCENKTRLLAVRSDLKRGHKKSCGCLQRENGKSLSNYITKHGMHGTRFYNIWKGMHERCMDHNNPLYGGRGITFDFFWLDFENFYKDMYPSYIEHCQIYGEADTTLDRKDVNGMYSKYNCRWATREEQASNTRQTQFVEYNGQIYSLRQLMNTYPYHPDLNINILYNRIFCSKWDIEKALMTPVIERHPITNKHKIIYNNQEYEINELVEKFCEPGVSRDILYNRLFKSPSYKDCFINNTIINPRIFSSEELRYPIEK